MKIGVGKEERFSQLFLSQQGYVEGYVWQGFMSLLACGQRRIGSV